MTRQDYELIAMVIEKQSRSEAVGKLAYNLAIELFRQNPNFNFTKFCRACGYPLAILHDQDGEIPA